MATPNMNLTLPTVGVTAGPAYATQINQALNVVDQHDHTSGSGVQITPAGLNINAALSIGSNDVTDVRTARFTAQGAALAGTTPDLACLYVVGDNLYYNDGAGNQIAITASGSIAGSAGNITGLVSPASVVYTSGGSPNYKFMSTATVSANLDAASLIIRNPGVTATFGLTLQAPTLVSNYSVTLPIPAVATSFLQMDSSGVMTTSVPTALGIDTGNIADSAITNAKLATDSVSTVKIIDANVTKAKLAADAFYSVITQDLTGSTTVVVPAGVTGITVTMVGGGGGGGSSAAAGLGGAGAGGNGGSIITAAVAVTPGETLTFTRGAGGTGGTLGAAGSSGGSSILTGSFGTLQASGGIGGAAGSGGTGGAAGSALRGGFLQAPSGAGGTSSGTNGGAGDASMRANGGAGGIGNGTYGGGGGGGAGLSAGGAGGNAGLSGNSAPSANNGGGGGGGGADILDFRAGADGRNGRCIIQYIGSV